MRNLFIIMTAALIFLPLNAQANIFESIWGQATATFSTIFNLKPNWTIYRDIAYGPHADEKADLYLLPGGNHPAVVFIHGGGWAGGDKSAYANYYANKYGVNGFSVISINYRLAKAGDPSTHWPAQLQDVQLAMRWLRTYAPYWGIDPNRICAFGDSAGGHLALFLGSLKTSRPGDRSASYAGVSPAANCVVDMFGPSDLTDPQELTVLDGAQLFGGKTYAQAPQLYGDASVIRYVTPQSAPTYIIQGWWDTIVFPAQSANMANRLIGNGVPTQLNMFYGGHWFQYLNPTSEKSKIDEQAIYWMSRLMKPFGW